MGRDRFASGTQREPVRKGQKWALIDVANKKWIPEEIEILDVVMVTEGKRKVRKCKIRETKETFHFYHCHSLRHGNVTVTEFMLAGDILTYYEQI
jgi:hypothetical protein